MKWFDWIFAGCLTALCGLGLLAAWSIGPRAAFAPVALTILIAAFYAAIRWQARAALAGRARWWQWMLWGVLVMVLLISALGRSQMPY